MSGRVPSRLGGWRTRGRPRGRLGDATLLEDVQELVFARARRAVRAIRARAASAGTDALAVPTSSARSLRRAEPAGAGRGVDEVPAWVVDTNVLVSGLLSPSGPPGRLVDVLVGRRLRLALDDRIEGEYREVLARPKSGIEQVRLGAFLAILQFQDHVTSMPWPYGIPPDEDVVVFLEVALQPSARTVVTGNLRHFPRGCRGPVTVLSPRAAWERLAGLKSGRLPAIDRASVRLDHLGSTDESRSRT